MKPLIKQARIMSKKYDTVVTNPPYMGINGFNSKIQQYIENKFESYKHDLCALFIKRVNQLTKPQSYLSMITMHL